MCMRWLSPAADFRSESELYKGNAENERRECRELTTRIKKTYKIPIEISACYRGSDQQIEELKEIGEEKKPITKSTPTKLPALCAFHFEVDSKRHENSNMKLILTFCMFIFIIPIAR